MSHIEEVKSLGIEALIDRHWDDVVSSEEMADTVVFTQQSRVLHKDNDFWTDYKVFCKRMIPIIKEYVKVLNTHLATQKNLNGGDREAALRVKGVIGLEWNRMAKIVGLSTACERILTTKTGHMVPNQLGERKFSKLLRDYYSSDKNPENPLQSIYYSLLFWVQQIKDNVVDYTEDNDDEDGADVAVDDDDIFNP
ncbi:hypothetical protein HD553DRAFT_311355 [Filobasidium floriforme]|uniref:uncharacterized protein n=1 Tax=Filobasidium floriforme TaxID=5210 RepID=UPI001E8CA93B|nr:uncharacterized protein HD553DRAFT_311355 [Filobasidium floriforme]KAH8084643.1 hypothetical protein HD553DRAFT_311355 [Filobasidium floriforme]